MLAALLDIPRSSTDWDRWSFDNRDSHNRIRAAIVAQGGPSLADYQLDPVSQSDVVGWLTRHQQAHIEMLGVLRLQSEDLQDVNLQDERQLEAWIFLHYQDHLSAESRLKI